MLMAPTPRGVRNNNPGNIRRGPTLWEGLAAVQPDFDFCTFTTPEYGIRALAVILRNYQVIHGLNTVADIIDRWAPPIENDTAAYTNFVCDRCGVTQDQFIDTGEKAVMAGLITAIIHMECAGYTYPAAVLDQGMAMAGCR
jgi:hypothetical protein